MKFVSVGFILVIMLDSVLLFFISNPVEECLEPLGLGDIRLQLMFYPVVMFEFFLDKDVSQVFCDQTVSPRID